MALAYPLAFADFWDLLPVASGRPQLAPQEELSGLGSGRVIAAQLASPLWRAEIALAPMTRQEAAQIEARIAALDGAQKSFLFYPLANPAPQDDPDGTILGASAPVISSIGGDNKSIAITGLPAGYQLRAGDFLSFVAGGRNALHRFVEDGAADGGGVTPAMELRPHLRPGSAAGAAIELLKPRCEMIVEPGSYAAGRTQGAIAAGMTFTALQKL